MRWCFPLAAALMACGGGTDEEPIVEQPIECPVGDLAREDGSCQAAGVPIDMPCAPGEVELDGGGCRPAGVGQCSAGFELASDGGCAAILPPAPCRDGEMALLGETSCHPVAPCGSGTWGDIDVSGNVEYVDASFIGTSTGSATAPWTTIGAALTAASSGATIAIAAGSYLEDLSVTKSVTIWGRCPAMVQVAGQGSDLAAFFVRPGASGSVLRGMSVTGTDLGIVVTGATDVLVEHVRIHDTGFRAVDVESTLGETSVTFRETLIERGVGEGIFQGGGTVTVERCVVRDNLAQANGLAGRGIGAQVHQGERAQLTVTGSIVENNHEVGITVIGSDGVIEDTLVRDSQPMPADGTAGWGLWLNHDGLSTPMQRSSTTVRGCVVEGNHDGGVALVGSDATIETTTVRSSRPAPGSPYSGMGIVLRNKYQTGDRAVLGLDSSVLVDNRGVGLYLLGSDATVSGIVIRGTRPTGPPGSEMGGRAVSVEPDPLSIQTSTIDVRASLIEDNFEHGIFVGGASAVIDATAIRDIQADAATGKFGRGLNVQLDVELPQFPGTATLTKSLIERTHEAGVAVLAASATLGESTIRDILPRPLDQGGGRGLIVQHGPATNVPSSLDATLLLVERAIDIGIGLVSSSATLEATVVRETQPRPDSLFGDGISALDFGLGVTRRDQEQPCGGERARRRQQLLGERVARRLGSRVQHTVARAAADGGRPTDLRGRRQQRLQLSGPGQHVQNRARRARAASATRMNVSESSARLAGVMLRFNACPPFRSG